MTDQEVQIAQKLLKHADKIGLNEWHQGFLEAWLARPRELPLREDWQAPQFRMIQRIHGMKLPSSAGDPGVKLK